MRHSDLARTTSALRILTPLTCIALLLLAAASLHADGPDPAARRLALLQVKMPVAQAVEHMAAALADDDPVVARTAARLLARFGRPALAPMTKALQHEDLLVRRTAAIGLGSAGPEATEPLATAIEDPHALVRQAVVAALAGIHPRTDRISELIAQAGKDEDSIVREAALAAAQGVYEIVEEIPVPEPGWKYTRDPKNTGEGANWFAVDFDDSAWGDIEIAHPWQDFGHDYQGYGWYRRVIDLPAREKPAKAILAFGGVDENAWIWINGAYAGDHAIGPEGYDKPFQIDVTDCIRWGAPNQFTVRAMNTVGHGGIWRPVKLVLLRKTN